MLVDVILLRRHGEKIHRGALLGARPVRGRLIVRSAKSVWHGKAESVANLTAQDDSMRSLLPILRAARLVRIQDCSLLITGVEQIAAHEGVHRRPAVETYQQTWWCRLVLSDGQSDDGLPMILEPA